jgi:hypothetical protein
MIDTGEKKQYHAPKRGGDSITAPIVLTPDDVAEMFCKSLKWVYKHAYTLNASRIGGSIFFTMEGVGSLPFR